jgi:FtsH-binding integral membrane protein
MIKDILRWVWATAIGILVAFGLIYLFQYAGSNLSPDVYDPETGDVLIPIGSTIALLIGWFIGTFAGGWLAMRLSKSTGAGWIIAGTILGAALYRSVTLADTWWIMALGLIIPLAAAWTAQRVTVAAA